MVLETFPLLEKVEGGIYKENILTSDLQNCSIVLGNPYMNTVFIWDIQHYVSFRTVRFRICIWTGHGLL